MSSITPISTVAGSIAARPEPSGVTPVPAIGAPLASAPGSRPPGKRIAEDEQRQVKAAADQIESYLRHVNTNLEFRVDDAAGKVVITVRERATGEMIRQIPSEEALAIAAQLDEYGVSGLLDSKS